MGFQTQSTFPGQAYSMGCINAAPSRQACPLPAVSDTSLARQKSIYSLTLEEFQNTLGDPGKSFGSMNMEELLKNIWTAEEGQAMAAAMGATDTPGTSIGKQASLQKQGSILRGGAIGQKTVDEVWKSVYQANAACPVPSPTRQRELTFREVTLEDFLVKAGIVPEEDVGKLPGAGGGASFEGDTGEGNHLGASVGVLPNTNIFTSATCGLPGGRVDGPQNLQINSTPLIHQPQGLSMSSHQIAGIFQQGLLTKQLQTVGAGGMLASHGISHTDNPTLIGSPVGLGGLGSPVGGGIAASLNASTSYGGLAAPTFKVDSPLSSDGISTSQGGMPPSPVFHTGFDGQSRKRSADGPLESVVERRQRRMIKNRESAARSRARKQAYTVELENELTELRAENIKLKLKQEKAEKQMKKVLAVSQEVLKEEKALRRTRTGPW